MNLTRVKNYLKKSKFIKHGLINAIITIIIFYIVFKNVNFKNSLDLLRNIDLFIFLISIFLSLFAVYINNLRWYVIIRKFKKIEFNILFKYSYIISFLNQILPSTIGGEAYKIYISKIIISSLSKSISITFLEKYFVLTTLLFLIIISNYFYNDLSLSWISNLMNIFTIIFILLIILLILFYKFTEIEIGKNFFNKFKILVENSFQYLKDIKLLFLVFGISLLSHINLLFIFTLSSLSLGIELDIFEISYIFFIIFLFSQLPISLGGWGIRETTTISGLALIGVEYHESFAISALFGITLLITYIPAIFFIYKDFDIFFLKFNKKN